MSTPRERRHGRTRRRILEHARKILVAEGMDGLSMRRLARRLNYSPAALYKYFPSKKEVLLAIREEGFRLNAAMQAASAPASLAPPARLLASGRAYLRFAETYPEHYLLMFQSPELGPGGVGEVAHNPDFAGLPQIIRDGVEQGWFRLSAGYTAEMAAFQCWVTVHGMAMLRRGILREAEAEFGRLCDRILKEVVASLAIQ